MIRHELKLLALASPTYLLLLAAAAIYGGML